MKQKTNLKDKVVTVIGATSGIGAATESCWPRAPG